MPRFTSHASRLFGLYELAAFWSQIVFIRADFAIVCNCLQLFDLTLDGLA